MTMCTSIQTNINVKAPIFSMPFGLAEVYAPWQQRSGYGPWELLAPLVRWGYRFLFLCRGGLVDQMPAPSAPFPAQFEDGYNVVAYIAERHADRIRRLHRLRFGTGQAMAVARGLYPNQPQTETRPARSWQAT